MASIIKWQSHLLPITHSGKMEEDAEISHPFLCCVCVCCVFNLVSMRRDICSNKLYFAGVAYFLFSIVFSNIFVFQFHSADLLLYVCKYKYILK